MSIQEQVPLKEFSTFKVGGPARYFTRVRSARELQEVLRWARQHAYRFFVLGGGSNILFDDAGFDGLVVKTEFHDLSIQGTEVSVGASVSLAELIDKTLSVDLVGMEFAAGIPGSVGGAVRGNAGTYGVDISSVLSNITIIDESDFSLRTLSARDCDFAYRHSMFKLHDHVITNLALQLTKGDREASKKIIEERIAIRRKNHPLEPSAGCIFKNVEFAKVDLDLLRTRGVAIDQFAQYKKIPTGHLIEELGLKGKTVGGAEISMRHANYIVNNGTARFEDVVTLISLIKQKVRAAYGIQLEEEIQIVS